jgi:hypothetical protein
MSPIEVYGHPSQKRLLVRIGHRGWIVDDEPGGWGRRIEFDFRRDGFERMPPDAEREAILRLDITAT